ncbi:MAG TPA: PilZ domain-containing protein [Terracidiphilus sp.]|nr:PilZ domain-containing protein [Terracidiphilus sp.]
MHMTQEPKVDTEQRGCQRFKVNAPLSLLIGEQPVLGYTRDLSNQGVYFYLSTADCARIEGHFEFLIDLPPEITLSSRCRIRCTGRALRTEPSERDLTGIAAEILDYSISR